MPLTYQHNVFKGQRIAQADTHWNKYIGNVQCANSKSGQWNTSQTELINKYLEHFCQEKNGTLESFKEDFDSAFLKNIEERIAIYNSDDMTNLSIDLKKYQSIS